MKISDKIEELVNKLFELKYKEHNILFSNRMNADKKYKDKAKNEKDQVDSEIAIIKTDLDNLLKGE